jgi:predicted permease
MCEWRSRLAAEAMFGVASAAGRREDFSCETIPLMTLITTVLPIFGTILLGWLARQTKFAELSTFRGLMDVVFYLLMPALLFNAVARGPALEVLGVATVYFSACLFVFAIAVIGGRLYGLSLAGAGMLGLNASYGNTVMVGIPIAVAALGTAALPPLLAIIAVHSAILLPLAGIFVEAGSLEKRKVFALLVSTLVGMLKNPVIMSILVAFVWRSFEVPVPELLAAWLKMQGAAAVPLALLCLGGTLPPLNARAVRFETVVGVTLKLVALPVVVWLIGRSAGLPPATLTVATLTAAMPTGANAFLFARRSEDLLEISAATVLLSTALSIGTLSVVLYFIV